MEVIPSIDLKGGACVRLLRGDFTQVEVFSTDPVGMALRWQEEGAPRLHIADLDGAVEGRPVHLKVVRAIASRLRVPLQVGGGVRDLETAERLVEAGAERVVLGTGAVEDPGLVAEALERLGRDRIIVAVDAREGKVAVRGWREVTARSVREVVEETASLGVERFLYTDIRRDGTLGGPDFAGIAQVVALGKGKVLASGGIATVEHLKRLAQMGVEGAIVGRALYSGALSLRQALAALTP